MQDSLTDGALSGIRILDLSRQLPGPFCSMLLADMGAEVIKVENPAGGDPARGMLPLLKEESVYFLSINRNKKSIALNLKAVEGREIFLKLVEGADALLEGFRPGTADRLGIGYQDVSRLNPGLVYCSLTGYGQDGPYRDRAGHDVNYIALGGALGLTGRPEGPPVIPAVQVADLGGALLAALAIVAALLARTRTERGQYIDVAMLDSVMAWLSFDVAKQWADGVPLRRGRMLLSGQYPCYNVYQTKDGQYMSLGALEPEFWANFCRIVGREDLIEHQYDDAEGILADVQAIFRSRTRAEWVRDLAGQDVCCEPVKTVEEVFTDPQVLHREMYQELEHPTEGPIKQVGVPLKFSGTPATIATPPPCLGQHTAPLLAELGYNEAQIQQLERMGVVALGGGKYDSKS
ncbi:MAG: CaiB/BaiF CoA transferase family protein [Anaerolineae bacterium]